MTPQQIINWLQTLPADAQVGVDEGGLTLIAHDGKGGQLGWLEVGGIPETP